MTRARLAPALFCLLPLAAAGVARAQVDGVQDIESLRAAVSGFATAQFGAQKPGFKLFVSVGQLDGRLRLPRCGTAPEAFLPSGAKPAERFTVGVRCKAPTWSIYVPVSIESELPVLVLKAPAARGASLTEADVEPQIRRVPGFASLYITDPALLTKRHLKNAAAPGTALTVELLVGDILIKRGQRVTIVASTGTFEVRAKGEAVADSTPSGRVRVQNLSSLRVVEGQAESADVVRIGP